MKAKNQDHDSVLKVWTRFKPSSTDPMLYDLEVHHQTMRSVMATLVSKYKSGEIAPQIAKSWEANKDKTEWSIVNDDKWSFENGDNVRREDIVNNFKRLVVLKNAQNSKSGLLEFLKDAENLKNINQDFDGIQIINDKIVFKFIKPMPDFLEKVSFGIYSIAHPQNYNQNGEWKDPRKVIASSAYRISKWTEDELELELRNNLYINKDSRNYKKIIFNYSKNDQEIYSNDIVIKEKVNPNIDKLKWSYASTTLDNNITYVKVMKWKDEHSIFHDRNTRIKLRNIFYKNLSTSGFNIVPSFFPLSIKGIIPFSVEESGSFDYQNKSFFSQPFFTTEKGNQLGDIFNNGFSLFCKEINAQAKTVAYPEDESDEEKVFDIQFLGTGIVIDDPMDDVNFMFKSKQGINLPDEDGTIFKKLEDNKIDIQEINRIIWEQGIIWPIRHYSMGFWIKKSSNIDLSELNLTMQPIDFQFVKKN